jgi:enoyl-CoA hydratase/carnithine racemase
LTSEGRQRPAKGGRSGIARLVSIDKTDHIATVRLERPEALNAISGAMADDIAAAYREVAGDTGAWVILLTAAGDKAFCVGADLKERASFSLEQYHENRKQIRGMFAAIRATPQPIIAVPFGYALGGGFELVLSSDLVVAAEGTLMGLPEARVGLLPAGGGTQLLARKIGPARAKNAIFTGAQIDASEWASMGLVERVVPQENLEDSALDLAGDICRSSPVAVRHAKAAIDGGFGVPLDQGIEIEHDAWKVVIESEDRAEGIAAFNEKRDPQWKNR